MRDEPDVSDNPIGFEAISVTSAGSDRSGLRFDEPIAVKITYRVTREAKNASIGIRVSDANGLVVFVSSDIDTIASLETCRQRYILVGAAAVRQHQCNASFHHCCRFGGSIGAFRRVKIMELNIEAGIRSDLATGAHRAGCAGLRESRVLCT